MHNTLNLQDRTYAEVKMYRPVTTTPSTITTAVPVRRLVKQPPQTMVRKTVNGMTINVLASHTCHNENANASHTVNNANQGFREGVVSPPSQIQITTTSSQYNREGMMSPPTQLPVNGPLTPPPTPVESV